MNQVRDTRARARAREQFRRRGCAVQKSPERDKMHARPSRVQPCWQPKTACVEGGCRERRCKVASGNKRALEIEQPVGRLTGAMNSSPQKETEVAGSVSPAHAPRPVLFATIPLPRIYLQTKGEDSGLQG